MDKKANKGSFKEVWHTWQIPYFMLSSLLIQALLTFLAPLRKRSSSGILKILIWILYLSADSIALYTIGLISSGIQRHDAAQSSAILAFWAPFLLLHLGGPDTITGLALEDNELWLRHSLQLGTQVMVTLYVFSLSIGSLTRRNNPLWVPTALMFIDGCTKYFERTSALYSASKDGIRASLLQEAPVTIYHRWADEHYSAQVSHIPSRFQVMYGPQNEGIDLPYISSTSTEEVDNDLDNDEVAKQAYKFFLKSRGLLADLLSSLKDDGEASEFLLRKGPREAFEVIAAELNLMYDVLHTKAFLAGKKRVCLRIVCFCSVIAAAFLFFFSLQDKNKRSNVIDVGVTFALLGGAIALDIAAFLMFVFSDWWVIYSLPSPRCLLSPWMQKKFKTKRWSKCISTYSLLECSFKWPLPPKFGESFSRKKMKDLWIDVNHIKEIKLEHEFPLNFIIKEIQRKAKLSIGDKELMEEVCSGRGNLVLEDEYFFLAEYLHPWTVDLDYDESLLTWHLATEICYLNTDSSKKEDDSCKLSKQLSDYMAYLLLRQKTLLSELVGKADDLVYHTIEDINNYWNDKKEGDREEDEAVHKKLCTDVLQGKTDDEIASIITKANDSRSVFHESCALAKQLMLFKDRQWAIVSKVWLELMCYAAIRSPPRSHLAQLTKGGELITFVWLFMVHLGFRIPVQPNQGIRSTKLIIDK